MAAPLTIQITDRDVRVRQASPVPAVVEALPLPQSSLTCIPAELPATVTEAVRRVASGRVCTTLVLPTSWCYVHAVNVSKRRAPRRALEYAFEEHLPLDVERLACDFLRDHAGGVIGVAVETDRVAPLLAALRREQIEVQRITLDALQHGSNGNSSQTLIWCDYEHVTVLSRDAGRLQGLKVVRLAPSLNDEEWIARVTDRLDTSVASTNGDRVEVAGCVSDRLRELLAQTLDAECPEPDDTGPRNAESAAGFDLARGALAPKYLAADRVRSRTRLAASLLIALVMLCTGLLMHRARLQHRLNEIMEWERQVFVQTFPGQKVPAGIALRFASERRRLEALTDPDASGDRSPLDALDTLQAVVSAIPADLRLDLQELRIDDRDITLSGRTRDHHQAEQLTQALDALDALQCSAPRTDRQREGGVRFFVHARRAGDTGSSTAGGR